MATDRPKKSARKRAKPPVPAEPPRTAPAAPAAAADGVPLETVVIAFQKALARAADDVVQQKQRDALFLLGQRTLYGVNSIEVDLTAGLAVRTREATGSDCVLLSFGAPPPQRSTVRFRVDSLPLESVKGPGVVLPALDPTWPEAEKKFRAIVVDEHGAPLPDADVVINIRPSSRARAKRITARSDFEGAVEFELDIERKTVRLLTGDGPTESIPGVRAPHAWLVSVELAGQTVESGETRIEIAGPISSPVRAVPPPAGRGRKRVKEG